MVNKMRAGIVENDTVINVIVADPTAYKDPHGREVVDGAEVEIGYVRNSDGVFVQPLPSLEARKQNMREAVSNAYVNVLEMGFTGSDGVRWSASPDAREKTARLMQSITAGKGLPNGKTSVVLRDALNQPHNLSESGIEALAGLGRDFMDNADDRQWELYDKIDSATSHSDLDAIDVRTGWPNE
jgi:hypothetical protein